MERIVDASMVLLQLGLCDSATDEERAVVANEIAAVEGEVRRYLGYDPVRAERTEYYPRQTTGSSRVGIWEANDTHAFVRELSSEAANGLQLRHIPIRSISTLHLDFDARSGTAPGAFGDDSLKTEGNDFWPNYDLIDSDGNKMASDGILRSYGRWPTTPGTVKIVYTAGYSDAELHGEDDVVDARPIVNAIASEAVRRVRKMFTSKKTSGVGFVAGNLTGERLGDYSYTADGISARRLMVEGLSSEAKSILGPFQNMGWLL